MLVGNITEFDQVRGLGIVTVSDGRDYLFHCIEVADGTRTIDVGRSVSFQPLPKFGRYEAGGINKL